MFETVGNAEIHVGFKCDGCITDERRNEALKKGTIIISTIGRGILYNTGYDIYYIVGDRWKSTKLKNFDLCSTCYNTGYFNHLGPYKLIKYSISKRSNLIYTDQESEQENCILS